MSASHYQQKKLGYKRTPTKAVLIVQFQNGEKWSVPAQIVADSRDENYKDEKEDTIGFIKAGTLEEFDLEDWAANNMNWEDVSPYAMKIEEASEPFDYRGRLV